MTQGRRLAIVRPSPSNSRAVATPPQATACGLEPRWGDSAPAGQGVELEVLVLVAQGLRNADIAERLFLSSKTVAHHVSAMLRKLDVPSRGQAGAKALHLGIVGQDR